MIGRVSHGQRVHDLPSRSVASRHAIVTVVALVTLALGIIVEAGL
jgi:hypothetical protein